jgi:anthranilate synthase component 1
MMWTGDPSMPIESVEQDVYQVKSSVSPEEYADRVRAAERCIRKGDTFQANISHRLETDAPLHLIEIYDALRRGNPAPYSALLEFPGVDLVSAGPELLLEVEGRNLITEPIAGTRPRGETPKEDHALEEEVQSSDKERAEHAMLVDLERNDLGALFS